MLVSVKERTKVVVELKSQAPAMHDDIFWEADDDAEGAARGSRYAQN